MLIAFNRSNKACQTAILNILNIAEPRAIGDGSGRPSTRSLLLGRPIHELFATPVRGAHADHAAEHLAEIRLVTKPARERNLGERLPRCSYQRAGKLEAPPADIAKGSHSDADLERSK